MRAMQRGGRQAASKIWPVRCRSQGELPQCRPQGGLPHDVFFGYCTAPDTVYNPRYCESVQELLKCAN